MPCYFASIQEMINNYPINKIYNQKDLMKVFPLLLTSIYGYLYKQKCGSHISTFKKDKINDSLKTIDF